MKKLILFGVIITLLALSIGTVVAKKSVGKRPCDDWPAATCLYTPSGNIHVWHGDDHATCMPMKRFNEKALMAKLANGWYESASKEGYICKWSYYSESEIKSSIVRPNGDNGINQWSTIGGSGKHYTRVDEVEIEPDGTNSDNADLYSKILNNTEDFDMENVAWEGTVFNITIWALVRDGKDDGNEVNVDLNIGGDWQGLSSWGELGRTYVWKSKSYDGNWTQDDVNSMVVRVNLTQAGFDYSGFVGIVYAVVTWE